MAACTVGLDAPPSQLGQQLIVKNCFFECVDDTPALGRAEGLRPRATSDLTYTKTPQGQIPYIDPSLYTRREAGAGVEGSLGGDFAPSSFLLQPVSEELPGDYGPTLLPAAAGGGYPANMCGHFWGCGVPADADESYNSSPCYAPYSGSGGRDQPRSHKPREDDAVGAMARLGVSPAHADQTTKASWSGFFTNMSSSSAPSLRGAPTCIGIPFDQVADVSELHPATTLTTVMLRNIPNRYTQGMLMSLLDDQGFHGQYDFVYLPMDFRNGINLGYAFVNLLNHPHAMIFMQCFQGFSGWFFDSAKVCEISWAHPHQGLAEHVDRYRNSPVMHHSMPDEYKPMVFKDGVRVSFPAPTKAIRAPKLRPIRERAPEGGFPREAS